MSEKIKMCNIIEELKKDIIKTENKEILKILNKYLSMMYYNIDTWFKL